MADKRRLLVSAAVVWLGAGLLPAASPVAKLDKRYQEFLNGPTSYLLTKTEREVFQNLGTDKDRDASIERFWEIRNPSPGTGTNPFKEEFYRRVAYANAHYGAYSGTDGWRTDMGKAYVLFGRPRSSMNYSINQELHPIELWFYSNPGLSELPPFFYVLFFERDDISGYRFYHPYVDGPARLVRAAKTKAQAYQMLRQVSPELAQASLSLIPGEPVDTDTFSGSMTSVSIINAIQGYREMPSYIATITARAQRLERVTSRIEYDLARASLLTFVAWQDGEPWLHWQLEINDPAQPKAAAGRVRYQVKAQLFAKDQLVFERTDSPAFTVPEAAQDGLKRRPFLYEDRMPVVPGGYRLMVTAVNEAAQRSYEAARDFTVAGPGDRAALSDILVVARYEPDARPRAFQFGGIKFLPEAGGLTRATSGLKLLYQVHLTEPRPAGLEVEYVIGSVATKFRKSFADKLDTRLADSWGALLTAKTLAIDDLAPGVYQVAVRIKDAATGRMTAGSTRVLVAGPEEQPPPIVVSRGAAGGPQWIAANQYERALCWLAQDRPSEALAPLEASWNASRNPAVRGLLQHLYEQTGQRSRARNLAAAANAAGPPPSAPATAPGAAAAQSGSVQNQERRRSNQ